ncbi:hypothetical protein EDD67_2759, partial [Salisediminibacterium halotolerans]
LVMRMPFFDDKVMTSIDVLLKGTDDDASSGFFHLAEKVLDK